MYNRNERGGKTGAKRVWIRKTTQTNSPLSLSHRGALWQQAVRASLRLCPVQHTHTHTPLQSPDRLMLLCEFSSLLFLDPPLCWEGGREGGGRLGKDRQSCDDAQVGVCTI